MSIKIFFKHLFNSIKKRPVQPLLLVLVIALSVALCIVAFNSREYLRIDNQLDIEASEGISDFVVNVINASDNRFLFENDIDTILGDSANTCGVFTLPMFYNGDDFVYGIASNYEKYFSMFSNSLIYNTPIHENEIKSSIFVTKDFANKKGLSVGDEITISIFGIDKNFSVFDIAEYPFIGQYSILVDIQSVIDVLSTSSMFLSVLSDDFIPSTKVYVDVNDNASIEDAMNSITSKIHYVVCTKLTEDVVVSRAMTLIVTLIVMLSAFFSFAVIYCCFGVLTAQRKSENALFYAIGAKGYMLNIISICEMVLYWFVGSIVGVLLSMPLSRLYINLSGLKYVSMYMTPWIIAVSCIVTLLASLGSILLFIFISNRSKNNHHKSTVNKKIYLIICVVILVLMILSLGLSFIQNLTLKTYTGIIGFFLCLISILLCSKLLYQFISDRCSNTSKLSIPARYALKNTTRLVSNKNSASILSLFFMIFAILLLLSFFAIKSMYYFEEKIVIDYVTSNIDEESVQKIREIDEVENVFEIVYDSNSFEINGKQYSFMLVSVSDIRGINPILGVNKLPVGNECYIPQTICMDIGYDIGDEITIPYMDKKLKLKIIGYQRENFHSIIFNAEDMGIGYQYIVINAKEGINREVLQDKIASKLALTNSVLVTKNEFIEYFKSTSLTYIVYVIFVTIFLTIFALIGIIDSFVSSYISRKDEFNNYRLAGMSKKDINKMKALEITYVLLIALLTFVIFSGFAFAGVYNILFSYNSNLFFVF